MIYEYIYVNDIYIYVYIYVYDRYRYMFRAPCIVLLKTVIGLVQSQRYNFIAPRFDWDMGIFRAIPGASARLEQNHAEPCSALINCRRSYS